jgi:phosphoribosylaminoimidazolecarboxamide formyltransferase / IMP cyclohydrolase
MLIKSALISVFYKDGLLQIVDALQNNGVTIYSTGGTAAFIEENGFNVTAVERLTDYPSILGGRVKTLHPKIFGGILAKRDEHHLSQLEDYAIPEIDLVIVDLYPFEETVAQSATDEEIVEKIDIGGISLIRAAAKNFRDVAVVPSRNVYSLFLDMYVKGHGALTLDDRQLLAFEAFRISSAYDAAISNYFSKKLDLLALSLQYSSGNVLRYGENPHQKGIFFGNLNQYFDQLGGKELSYNNLVDIDSAIGLIREFKDHKPTFAVIKHTNACGVASDNNPLRAWEKALESDPLSAFGGIIISNCVINDSIAQKIDEIFYEVLIAPDFTDGALDLLLKKKKRIILKDLQQSVPTKTYKSMFGGMLEQEQDLKEAMATDFRVETLQKPNEEQIKDIIFAIKCVKHLKSNAICLVQNEHMVGMGSGNTSRVDAVKQAIQKATNSGLLKAGAVLASDAFFPFSDSIEIAGNNGITAIVQPGGSLKDQDSVDMANKYGIAMVFTGFRHFKH